MSIRTAVAGDEPERPINFADVVPPYRDEAISESDRRLNVEGRIRSILASHGGETIVSSPDMERLIAELRVEFDALVFDGRFLPTIEEMR